MKSYRYRVVVIGTESSKILSQVTSQLTMSNSQIESISSLRLGHSFIILLMIETIEDKNTIENCLRDISNSHGLQLIIDLCTRKKYRFVKSNVFMRIRGEQLCGVKSYIITEFTNAGLDIHGLESESYCKNGKDSFVINIKGLAKNGIEDLTSLTKKLEKENMEVAISNAWELLV